MFYFKPEIIGATNRLIYLNIILMRKLDINYFSGSQLLTVFYFAYVVFGLTYLFFFNFFLSVNNSEKKSKLW